ncbi:MAG: hypothetical protein HC824_06815 [Synechococcales cyanobacterium RM1_1_8]|nr:hypothetical protein [Synechococcales cyanobacterium RM1_1_8]
MPASAEITAAAPTSPPALGQSNAITTVPSSTARQVQPQLIAQSDEFPDSLEDPSTTPLQRQLEQEKLRLEQEKLELETKNVELQQNQLQLRRDILNRENQQLGLTENSRAIPIEQAGSRFDGTLEVVPIESKILVFQSSSKIAKTIAQELIDLSKAPGNYGITAIVIYEPEEFSNVNSYRLYESLRKGFSRMALT